jgi:hypothetical protein
MYAGWLTISAMILASGMWLAWEGVHAQENSARFSRYRALYCVGALLAMAATGLAAMGWIAYDQEQGHGTLIAVVAFSAAVALGIGAIAVVQAATQLRRNVAGKGSTKRSQPGDA